MARTIIAAMSKTNIPAALIDYGQALLVVADRLTPAQAGEAVRGVLDSVSRTPIPTPTTSTRWCWGN